MSTWEHENMSTWEHEHTRTWAHENMSAWEHEHMKTWAHENMSTWEHEHMSTWEHEHVRTWARENGKTWTHKPLWSGIHETFVRENTGLGFDLLTAVVVIIWVKYTVNKSHVTFNFSPNTKSLFIYGVSDLLLKIVKKCIFWVKVYFFWFTINVLYIFDIFFHSDWKLIITGTFLRISLLLRTRRATYNWYMFVCPQTLSTISAEKNSTIIFPLPIDIIRHFLPDMAGDESC